MCVVYVLASRWAWSAGQSPMLHRALVLQGWRMCENWSVDGNEMHIILWRRINKIFRKEVKLEVISFLLLHFWIFASEMGERIYFCLWMLWMSMMSLLWIQRSGIPLYSCHCTVSYIWKNRLYFFAISLSCVPVNQSFELLLCLELSRCVRAHGDALIPTLKC